MKTYKRLRIYKHKNHFSAKCELNNLTVYTTGENIKDIIDNIKTLNKFNHER